MPKNGVVTHPRVTPRMPIAESVINRVHNLAKLDKIPDGLKITDGQFEVSHDNDLIAGVDCNINNENKSENEDDEECNETESDNDDDNEYEEEYEENIDENELEDSNIT